MERRNFPSNWSPTTADLLGVSEKETSARTMALARSSGWPSVIDIRLSQSLSNSVQTAKEMLELKTVITVFD
jgi:hypothetical protein